MKITIDPRKSVYENSAVYFDKAKKLRKKAVDTKKAIEKAKEELAKARMKKEVKEEVKEEAKIKEEKIERKKEWFESFRWFFSSDGFLAVGGKNADQNEELVKKHFLADDLFYHADIPGGSAVILKNGKSASDKTRNEAAQFAACFSNAWKQGFATINVTEAGREQVSKTPPSGTYLEKGSFIIKGERKTYKNVPLQLLVGIVEGMPQCAPALVGTKRFSVCFELIPGDTEKEEAADVISKSLKVEKEKILPLIPAGKAGIKKVR